MRKRISNTIQKIVSPINEAFAKMEISGLILLLMTIMALYLANSSFGEQFLHIWHWEVKLSLGDFNTAFDLHFFINDILMTLFFVVVGGEIKREIVEGALSSKEKALLPVIAALGGMFFPGIIYALLNWNQPTISGWGIPTATDIAFSLTIISLLGKRIPFSLKIFLAALAIADDLGAIVVIAIFYSSSIAGTYLFIGLLLCLILFALNKLGVTQLVWYILFGIALWYSFYMGGVHPTISGVVLAFAVPFKLKNWDQIFETKLTEVKECVTALSDKTLNDKLIKGQIIERLQNVTHKMESPLHNLLVFLHPYTNYIIMPLFAFANAGVIINASAFGSITSPIGLGIILGLMIGKSTGILVTSWLAVKFKIAKLPDDLNWKLLYGMAWVAGIGFTMSMFVTGLAFSKDTFIETAKIAILLASLLSGIIGYALLRLFTVVK